MLTFYLQYFAAFITKIQIHKLIELEFFNDFRSSLSHTTPRLIDCTLLSYYEFYFYMQSLFHIKLLTFYPDVLHCLKVAEANLSESRFVSLTVFEKQRQLSGYPVSH